MSNLINKAKDALSGNKAHHDTQPTGQGPHQSTTANVVDPTVDSTTGTQHTLTPHHAHHHGPGITSTAGPHSSDTANKLDPRVDSDLDHRANPSSHTTAGPHSSDLANKLDPRVDSDLDHRNNPAGGLGTQETHDNTVSVAKGLVSGTGTGPEGTTGNPVIGSAGTPEGKKVQRNDLLNRLGLRTKPDNH